MIEDVWIEIMNELCAEDVVLVAISDNKTFQFVYPTDHAFPSIQVGASIEGCPMTLRAVNEGRIIDDQIQTNNAFDSYIYRVLPLEDQANKYLTIIRKMREKLAAITVKLEDKWIPIPYEEVVYLEAHDRKTHVVSANNYRGIHRLNLKDLEQELPKSLFIRCHRSYIINIGQVKEIHPDSHATFVFVMKNNERIPISQNYARYVRRLFGF